MDDEAMRIIEELRNAFPRSPPASLPVIRQGTTIFDDEVREVEAFFANKSDWTVLAGSDLDSVSGALAFLSDEAACFFLPAYLTADLKRELKCVEPVFALTHGLDGSYRSTHSKRGPTDENAARRRWSTLTATQCRAIASYLGHRLRSSMIEEPTIEASLDRYWLPWSQE